MWCWLSAEAGTITVTVSPRKRVDAAIAETGACVTLSSLASIDFVVSVSSPRDYIPHPFKLQAPTENCPTCDPSLDNISITVTDLRGNDVDFTLTGSGTGGGTLDDTTTFTVYLLGPRSIRSGRAYPALARLLPSAQNRSARRIRNAGQNESAVT